jgi:hypothetical protein
MGWDATKNLTLYCKVQIDVIYLTYKRSKNFSNEDIGENRQFGFANI